MLPALLVESFRPLSLPVPPFLFRSLSILFYIMIMFFLFFRMPRWGMVRGCRHFLLDDLVCPFDHSPLLISSIFLIFCYYLLYIGEIYSCEVIKALESLKEGVGKICVAVKVERVTKPGNLLEVPLPSSSSSSFASSFSPSPSSFLTSLSLFSPSSFFQHQRPPSLPPHSLPHPPPSLLRRSAPPPLRSTFYCYYIKSFFFIYWFVIFRRKPSCARCADAATCRTSWPLAVMKIRSITLPWSFLVKT